MNKNKKQIIISTCLNMINENIQFAILLRDYELVSSLQEKRLLFIRQVLELENNQSIIVKN
jgi:hypothetical protein